MELDYDSDHACVAAASALRLRSSTKVQGSDFVTVFATDRGREHLLQAQRLQVHSVADVLHGVTASVKHPAYDIFFYCRSFYYNHQDINCSAQPLLAQAMISCQCTMSYLNLSLRLC